LSGIGSGTRLVRFINQHARTAKKARKTEAASG
jgi:hypothetical protein